MSTSKPTPELDKLSAIASKSQACGEFLDWMRHAKAFILAVRHEHDEACGGRVDRRDPILSEYGEECGMREGQLYEASYTIEKLLAEFFEIDLQKVEEEKRMLLAQLRDREE